MSVFVNSSVLRFQMIVLELKKEHTAFHSSAFDAFRLKELTLLRWCQLHVKWLQAGNFVEDGVFS